MANNDPLIEVLKSLQDKRKEQFPDNEDFKRSKLEYAALIGSDFHCESHKRKAEQYKVNSIQYNKHMKKYTDRLQEIADLRTEAAAGKTLYKMEIEDLIKNHEEMQKAQDEQEAKREAIRKLETETLKGLAFQHNLTWINTKLSWPERYAGKDEVKEIISALNDRGVNIIPDLNEQIHKITGGV